MMPREGVIDAVVDVVAGLAVAHGLADDARDGGGGGGHQEAARLGQDLDVRREQAVDLGVDLPGQRAEGLHVPVVGRREAAADVEDLDLVAARLRPRASPRRTCSAPGRSSRSWCTGCRRGSSGPRPPGRCANAASIRSTASPGSQPNLEDSSTIEPVLGTRSRSTTPACGAYCLIFFSSLRLSKVTSGLYWSSASQRLLGLDRVGVDDLVPDEILLLLGAAGAGCSRTPA